MLIRASHLKQVRLKPLKGKGLLRILNQKTEPFVCYSRVTIHFPGGDA